MWYRFEEGNPLGIPRVTCYHVAFYDVKGMCFDEDYYLPDEIHKVIPYVETIEDVDKQDRSKVFVHFGNGDIYELKMEKVN